MTRPQRSAPSNRSAVTAEQQSFFKQVYKIVRTIPRAKVLTYGQIATLLGSPYMARQVGWAMHGCPKGLPWQRVVGAGGRLLINSLSQGGGSLLQRQLLEAEGVGFLGQSVDMAAHQFVPPMLQRLIRKQKSKKRKSSGRTTQKTKA